MTLEQHRFELTHKLSFVHLMKGPLIHKYFFSEYTEKFGGT